MTLNDVYKISKALITIVDGGDAKSFKGTISNARDFIDHYEAMNKISKALITIVDGGDAKSFKGHYQ